MAIREIITANCENGQLSKSKIARQWDDQGTLIQFAGYPEPETDEELIFRLIVWMRASEDAEPVELPPIELEADQWLISNYYTQLPQMLRFQLCITNSDETYEKHSPIFSGIVDKSLSHDGEEADIDVNPLFDPYKKYVDELVVNAGARVVDTELDETSTHLVENKAVASAVAAVNGRLEELEGDGSGLSADAKQALLALLQKVAYTVIDGQDYYDALETALNPPANLRSISAVYTQSTPVYKNTALDDLKADLVVTATYSDSSIQTVPANNYALTGSLNAGTASTITVNYGGKRTTFTVTVEPDALYPLEDGVKTWESAKRQLTVSDGNTVKGELLSGGTKSMFVNISQVSLNTDAVDSTNNHKVGTAKLFTIPTGATVVATITPKYVNYWGSNIQNKQMNVALRDKSGTTKLVILPTTAYKNLVVDTPIVNTFTAESDLDIWNITMWMEAEPGSICTVEFELELIVNGTKFI